MNKVYLLALLLILNGLGGMAQPTDYVAYYLFNGNANDESVNANNGVLGDGFTTASFPTLTTDRFGNVDAAYSFDGGDYIDLGTSISLGNA